MDKAHERKVDELIDAALTGWAAEPRAGLEKRTMARLNAAARQQKSRPAWGWFAAGIATAAVFTFALAMFIRRPGETPTTARVAPAPTVSAENPATQAESAPAKIMGRSNPPVQHAKPRVSSLASHAVVAVTPAPSSYRFVPTPRTAALPRAERFPTPAPLSEQELLLAKLAAQASPLVLRTLAEASQQHEIQPIEIKPIAITPIEPGPQQSSTEGEPQ